MGKQETRGGEGGEGQGDGQGRGAGTRAAWDWRARGAWAAAALVCSPLGSLSGSNWGQRGEDAACLLCRCVCIGGELKEARHWKAFFQWYNSSPLDTFYMGHCLCLVLRLTVPLASRG